MRVVLSAGIVASVAVGGCAFVYGYDGYHAGQGGGGGGGATNSSSTSSTGGGGGASTGSGGGNGGAPGCDLAPDPRYRVAWSQVFDRDMQGTVAGVHIDAEGLVSFAGTFKGKSSVGGVDVASGAHRAALFAQFPDKSGPSFATAFKSSDDVVATALGVDAAGNPYGFGTFTSQLTLGTSTLTAPAAGSSFTFQVAFDKTTGDVQAAPATKAIACTPIGPKCEVSVSAAHFAGSDLLLAGSINGTVSFTDGSPMSATTISANDEDGFAAIYGTKAFSLTATGQQAMTDIAENSNASFFFGGVARGAAAIGGVCSSGPAAMGADIAILRYSLALTATWPCQMGAFIYPDQGDQLLDSIAAAPGGDGGAIIAGRTDGHLDLAGPTPYDGTPAIFVARLDGQNSRITKWVKVIPVAHLPNNPVHVELDASFTRVLLSGTFDGTLSTDTTITSAVPTGFATLLDLNGNFVWTGAMLPCSDGGSTSMIASFVTPDTLAIAGTLSGPAQFAGEMFGTAATGDAFYVARVDHK